MSTETHTITQEQVETQAGLDEVVETSFYDRFEVVEHVGKGRFGEVKKIRDYETGAISAAKIISLGHVKDWSEITRFEDEMKALGKLDHEGIVRYMNHYIEEDTRRKRHEQIIQIEYIDGETLAERIGERFSEEELIAILEQGTQALRHAHSREVIHRDIKPQNIMLDSNSNVKVTDFGLAKFMEEESRASSAGKGTLSYMAPEQLKGESIVPETDIYSWGLTVLSLATGKLREKDVLRANPLQDIEHLRQYGQYSKNFVDTLETILSLNPEERRYWEKEDTLKIIEPIVVETVRKPESIDEIVEKKETRLEKWERKATALKKQIEERFAMGACYGIASSAVFDVTAQKGAWPLLVSLSVMGGHIFWPQIQSLYNKCKTSLRDQGITETLLSLADYLDLGSHYTTEFTTCVELRTKRNGFRDPIPEDSPLLEKDLSNEYTITGEKCVALIVSDNNVGLTFYSQPYFGETPEELVFEYANKRTSHFKNETFSVPPKAMYKRHARELIKKIREFPEEWMREARAREERTERLASSEYNLSEEITQEITQEAPSTSKSLEEPIINPQGLEYQGISSKQIKEGLAIQDTLADDWKSGDWGYNPHPRGKYIIKNIEKTDNRLKE